ncbi:MAG: ABC transporter permease [Spirochaetales bacterium]|nr:ABC transporter permease [Spirochaetales bacterium]
MKSPAAETIKTADKGTLDRKKIVDGLSRFAIPIALGVLIVIFSIMSSSFLTSRNIINIFRQVSIVGICAVGMTFVILTGGIDLSVGSVIGVAVVSASSLMVAGVHPVAASIFALLIGVVLGVIIGFFINEVGVPPLITTLAFMTALRGVAYTTTKGLPVYGFPESFAFLGQGYIGGIPVPVIIMILVFIGGYILLNKTKFGRYVYGIGGNEEATRLSGINVKLTKYKIYILESFLASLAGIVLLSRVNSGQPKAGQGYEMDIITAVVLGGVSIAGGSGKITGVITGVLLMGVLTNGMILINVDEYSQWIVKGVVLLAAVSLDQMSHRTRD